jgi:hypothetical protein
LTGCGHGTRPWHLPLSSNVYWFDVDLPNVVAEKVKLLQQAGAQLHPPPVHCDFAPASGSAGGATEGPAQDCYASSGEAHPSSEARPSGATAEEEVPLRVGRYTPVVSHLLKADFAATLERQGWDPAAPTIWLACECCTGLLAGICWPGIDCGGPAQLSTSMLPSTVRTPFLRAAHKR